MSTGFRTLVWERYSCVPEESAPSAHCGTCVPTVAPGSVQLGVSLIAVQTYGIGLNPYPMPKVAKFLNAKPEEQGRFKVVVTLR